MPVRVVGNLPVINNLAMGHDLSMTLDDVIAEARLAKCQLACGGHLWCEQTQAIWSIDLDGNGVGDLIPYGEAATEIPRQIRLRGMSGPVLIDVPRLPRVWQSGFWRDYKMHLTTIHDSRSTWARREVG